MSATGAAGPLLERPRLGRRETWAVALFTLAVALIANAAFLRRWPLAEMLGMNDVPSILAGYRLTPHPLVDGLRWWHGPWIQQGIYAFRPASAYLYWAECWIGLHWGFLADAWLGYLLFGATCLLSAALTWRLTRSRACLWLAALLAPLPCFFNIGQPPLWLAWFPIHQDLMMTALLLAALLSFDVWREQGGSRALGGAWAFFALACLSKEHAYIFPLFAASVALLRKGRIPVWTALAQAGLMLASVGLLWVYRAHVIVHPRNPTAGLLTQAHALLVFMYSALGRYLITAQGWLPGLAVLLLALMGAALRFRQGLWGDSVWGRAYIWLPLCFGIVWLYLSLSTPSAAVSLAWLLGGDAGPVALADLGQMLIMLYGIYLLWKYRRVEPTGAVWTWMLLSYTPVAGFMGWHYLLPAWFLRVPYDVMIVRLVWRDLGRPKLSWRAWPRPALPASPGFAE